MTQLLPGTFGTLLRYWQGGRDLELIFENAHLRISAIGERTARLRIAPEGKFVPRRSWDVVAADDDFPIPLVALREDGQSIRFEMGAFQVIYQRGGGLCFEFTEQRFFRLDELPAVQPGGPLALRLPVEPGERFYGFGERSGLLEKTGSRMINWATDPNHLHGPDVEAMYIAIPFALALRPGLAWGLFFHNTFRSEFDLTQPGELNVKADGGELDFYILCGLNPVEVVQSFSELVGRAPLPPLWSLGYHQSRWSYGSEREVRDLVEEFRRRKIPLDAVHLDIDYMDGYRDFTWNRETFPDPAGLTRELKARGVRLVAITDAGVKVDPAYEVYASGQAQDAFVRTAQGEEAPGYVWPDDSVWPDFSRPDVRAWWGQQQARLLAAGVAGIWNDMNEPVVFDRPFSEGGGGTRTLPLDAPQGPLDERSTHAELHNLYALGMAQACYEGLEHGLEGERPFALCRSGYAGIQRWTASWMGDNHSSWEHLEMSLPQLINMGLSGVPFVGVDIGGFTGNASPELFARWIQAGALFPFCRGHSCIGTIRQEPWSFGPQVEDIARAYLHLRYRLLPYIYSLFWNASQRGDPVMRPLLYQYPEDPLTAHLSDQFLLGPFLMAAPVVRPGVRARSVYLPEGEWYAWESGEALPGGQHILAEAPLEHMPLYVRGGAILPVGPEMIHTGEKPFSPLTLEIYPGDCEFTLYEDDGHSLAYQQGASSLRALRMQRTAGQLRLSLGERQGSWRPPARKLVLRIYGVPEYSRLGHTGGLYERNRHRLTLELDDDRAARELTFRL